MLIENTRIAESFGIQGLLTEKSQYIFGAELRQYSEQSDIILLDKRESLYNYPLSQIEKFLRTTQYNTLVVLCEGLTNPRGNGERHWVNIQNGNTNFNTNIFLYAKKYNNPWELQERVSTAIARILSQYTQYDISMHYPFHYILTGGKVAGHLIQKIGVDDGKDFLRIGIGVNTATSSPLLPSNDSLSTRVFHGTNTLNISQSGWIELSKKLQTHMTANITDLHDFHEEYLDILHIKNGDTVSIYRDHGNTQIRKQDTILQGTSFQTLTREGGIITSDCALPNGSYHIIKDELKGG